MGRRTSWIALIVCVAMIVVAVAFLRGAPRTTLIVLGVAEGASIGVAALAGWASRR
jgi:hypothetical protein